MAAHAAAWPLSQRDGFRFSLLADVVFLEALKVRLTWLANEVYSESLEVKSSCAKPRFMMEATRRCFAYQ